MARPNKAVVMQRTEDVEALVVRGLTRGQMLQFVSEKTEWGKEVSVRTVDNYIRRASDNIQATAESNRAWRIAMADAQLRDLYVKSMQIQDYKAALAIRKEISKLFGLYPEATGPGESDDGWIGRHKALEDYTDAELVLLESYGVKRDTIHDAEFLELEEDAALEIPKLPEPEGRQETVVDKILGGL